MKNNKLIIFLIPVLMLASCSGGPVPIEYGTDECNHCRMVIMDHRYGAEIVLETGKALKFDAIECMVGYLKKDIMDHEEGYQVLITDFGDPGNLVDARLSFFLHSKGLPSPMGLFLTAFSTETAAQNALEQHGGHIYTWEQLIQYFDLIQIDYTF
jgi:copper chaperone NosL